LAAAARTPANETRHGSELAGSCAVLSRDAVCRGTRARRLARRLYLFLSQARSREQTPRAGACDTPRQEKEMNEQDFQNKLGDLMKQIESLPASERAPLEKLATETRDRHEKMKKTIGELQDSLDYLRLSVKYLVFDLEATRRENDYLRKLIETRASQEENNSEGAD
jgi:hypothetical protein